MPSRISGACNGCRTKKQKCSGDRSGCSQCVALGIPCTWPEQRKRGPAKGYIEGLENRLHDAESLLLALLPLVTPNQLHHATESLDSTAMAHHPTGSHGRDSRSPPVAAVRSSPPILNKKTGIDYWESFPLDTADNIRRWQQDCADHSHAHSSHQAAVHNASSDDLPNTAHAPLSRQSGTHSRQGSVEFKAGRQPPSLLRTMSTDAYRSGSTTPAKPAQRSAFPAPAHQGQSQLQHRSSSLDQPNWQPLSLFSPLPASHSSAVPTSSSNHSMDAEALLLQSFADSTWAAQHQSQGLDAAGFAGNGLQSGPMEIDTGFFTSDLQRRLFW